MSKVIVESIDTSQTCSNKYADGNGGGCFRHVLHSFRCDGDQNVAYYILMKGGGTHPPQASGEGRVLSGCYKEKAWREVMYDKKVKVSALTALFRAAVRRCFSTAAGSKFGRTGGNQHNDA